MKTRKNMALAQGINSVLILLTLAVGSGAVSVNTAWCQVTTEEWVARYNAPYSGIDNAEDIAVDAAGNAYVTGATRGSDSRFTDYITVKYDAAGNQLWVARYDGSGNGYDNPSALAVDAAGNVYVTGQSDGSGTGYDYATIKYDAGGNQLWVARYNGPGNATDRPSALAVDAAGNVYVTGASWGLDNRSIDYATVKYDTNGNELWVARLFFGPDVGSFVVAIAVDAVGNVYVTGSDYGHDRSGDYATVKYDAGGNQLWVVRYNGPGNSDDRPSALAVDAFGNVYVTGTSQGSRTFSDYATVKYDAGGNQLWVARYNGPSNGDDNPSALAVDAAGNVYVTGSSQGSGTGYDYATVKYDVGGNELYVHRYNGPDNGTDLPSALAVDAAGNVYVAGQSEGPGLAGDDYATVKYDAGGNELWVARCGNYTHGPIQIWDDRPSALAVDAAGNVCVTGSTSLRSSIGLGNSPSDYVTVKYDTNGKGLWVARYNGPGNGDDRASALAVDAAGNVYVTGSSQGSDTGYDYATVKYDAGGNELYVHRYNGAMGMILPLPSRSTQWAMFM